AVRHHRRLPPPLPQGPEALPAVPGRLQHRQARDHAWAPVRRLRRPRRQRLVAARLGECSVTPYPADFGGYVIGALPYAGAEALRIAAWCIAFVAPVAAACWLLGRARRLARPSTPGIRHLHRAAANADDRHAPVTRELPLGDLVVSREVERD